jgi:hypothetical protein
MPSGRSCTVAAPERTCTIRSLIDGSAQTFSVVAIGGADATAWTSGPSNAVQAAPPGAFAPSGVLVTVGDGAAQVTWTAPSDDGGGAATAYDVTASPGGGSCSVTAPVRTCQVSGLVNGQAYSFAVVARGVGPDGTAWVSAPSAPATATPVAAAASTGATATTAASGGGGSTNIANPTVTSTNTTATVAPRPFNAVSPERVFDTRPGEGGLRSVPKVKVDPSHVIEVALTDLRGDSGLPIVPGAGVGAVSLNVTATNPEGDGFVTAYPCGARPEVSSLNVRAGQTVANAVIAPVSPSGTVCFFASVPTDLLADVNGWFAAGAGFTAAGPRRVFDTRTGSGLRTVAASKLGAGRILEVALTDLAGLVPATGVAAVSLNVTATEPEGAGFVTVYPCGERREVSSLNVVADQTVANAVVTPVSPSGTVCFYSSVPTHLIADVNGWFVAGSAFTPVGPSRLFDTRAGTSGLRIVSTAKIGGATAPEVRVVDLAGLVPASGVTAVSLNVTATDADGAGYVTVYPCGMRREVSSLNLSAGQTIPNAVITPVSPTGTVCFYSSVPTNLVVDLNGWF